MVTLSPARIRRPANADPIGPAPTIAIRRGSLIVIYELQTDRKPKMSAVSMCLSIETCQAVNLCKTGRVYITGRLTYLVTWPYASTIAQPANRTYERRRGARAHPGRR